MKWAWFKKCFACNFLAKFLCKILQNHILYSYHQVKFYVKFSHVSVKFTWLLFLHEFHLREIIWCTIACLIWNIIKTLIYLSQLRVWWLRFRSAWYGCSSLQSTQRFLSHIPVHVKPIFEWGNHQSMYLFRKMHIQDGEWINHCFTIRDQGTMIEELRWKWIAFLVAVLLLMFFRLVYRSFHLFYCCLGLV